jgi:hypothetical protein
MIRALLIATVLTWSFPASAAQTQFQTVVEFSKSPARGRNYVTVSIEMSDYRPSELVVYRAQRVGRSAVGHTDSIQCPALLSAVESISAIPIPALKAGPAIIMIGDGTGYSLTVHSSNLDSITVTSSGGPLAQWINEALTALEDCWSSA